MKPTTIRLFYKIIINQGRKITYLGEDRYIISGFYLFDNHKRFYKLNYKDGARDGISSYHLEDGKILVEYLYDVLIYIALPLRKFSSNIHLGNLRFGLFWLYLGCQVVPDRSFFISHSKN